MLRILAALATLVTVAAAAPVGRACCDLWVFEPAGGRAESYAIQLRGSGLTVAVELSLDRPARLVADPEARALVRRWIAASHKPDASSVLIDAPNSQFRIGPFPGVPDEIADPETEDGDTLVYIRHASAAQARGFVDDIDPLSGEMNAAMKAVIPAR